MDNALSLSDEGNHYPTADDGDMWQESWAFAWHDPVQHIGGWHHLGFQRGKGVADLWSWIAVRGEFVHRYQSLTLPVPADDFSDLKIGPFAIRATRPLAEHNIVVDDGTVRAEFDCKAYIGPFTFSYSAAKGHYEMYGSFTGQVQLPNRTVDVQGISFIDRSWGQRDWSSLLAYRAVWACFGDDLAIKIYTFVWRDGPQAFGTVIRNGRQHALRKIEIDATIGSDGVHPTAVAATAWLDGVGGAVRFTGICEGADICVHRDDFMTSHANAVFDMGGRIGTGFVEAQELKKPTPWDREALNLTV